MVATNFTATFVPIAEGLWLGCLLLGKSAGARVERLAIFRPALALVAGVALLGPLLPGMIATSRVAVQDWGVINWIKLQPISWPFTTLHGAAGSNALFWTFVTLGVFGVWRQWSSARPVSAFFAAWMLGPLAAVMAITYLVKPLEFPRYVIFAFVGLFAFAGLGAASLRSTALRIALAALLMCLSMGPVHQEIRHSREAAWRTATALAAALTTRNDQIGVFPPYAVNVVRYYLSPDRRGTAVRLKSQCGSARLLIMSGWDTARQDRIMIMESCYPRTLAHLQLVELRSR